MVGTRVPSLIAGRRVERERQIQPVGALVLDQSLLDRAHLGRRIGNVGDGDARGSKGRFAGGTVEWFSERSRQTHSAGRSAIDAR